MDTSQGQSRTTENGQAATGKQELNPDNPVGTETKPNCKNVLLKSHKSLNRNDKFLLDKIFQSNQNDLSVAEISRSQYLRALYKIQCDCSQHVDSTRGNGIVSKTTLHRGSFVSFLCSVDVDGTEKKIRPHLRWISEKIQVNKEEANCTVVTLVPIGGNGSFKCVFATRRIGVGQEIFIDKEIN